HVMPAGLLVIVPVPLPGSVTVNVYAVAVKIALTLVLLLTVTWHAPVPLHAPDHPEKTAFAAAVATRLTCAPLSKTALHVVWQSIPAGVLVTVPKPVPEIATESDASATKLAVTELFCFRSITQFPMPAHEPLHPAKRELVPAEALRTTCVPVLNTALHVFSQESPRGVLLTVPVPVPENPSDTV